MTIRRRGGRFENPGYQRRADKMRYVERVAERRFDPPPLSTGEITQLNDSGLLRVLTRQPLEKAANQQTKEQANFFPLRLVSVFPIRPTLHRHFPRNGCRRNGISPSRQDLN